MAGRHRRGDPANRGKGPQPSGKAYAWVSYWDANVGEEVTEQYFDVIHLNLRVEQLEKAGARYRVTYR